MIDNMRAIHISIVGLSSSTMFDLRNTLRALIPKTYGIHWVNVTDAQLDLLIIDQDFFEARSIQKILSYRKIAVLQVSRQTAHRGQLIDSTLYLPLADNDDLCDWLSQHVLERLPVAEVSDQPATQPIDVHIFERLTSKTLGMVKLIDAHGVLGIADTQQELFWPAYQRDETLVIDHTLGVMYSTSRDLKDTHQQPIDLKQWLWQVVWNSPSYAQLVQPHDYVRLLFWPKPNANAQRREVLRLAASFQHTQLSVAQLAEHVQMPLSRVQHFASSLIAAGLAETLPRDQHPVVQPIPVAPKASAGLKGLFSRLREQLGM